MRKMLNRINAAANKYGGLLAVVGLALAIGSIIFAVYISKQSVVASNIPTKELSCILNYGQQLINKNTDDTDFKILYKNVEVVDPYIFSITIQNTGDYAITNDDFKSEFSIDFSGDAQIISANVYKSTNSVITDKVVNNGRFEGSKFYISDFFLNPNESFTIHIMTDGNPNSIAYSSRIQDVSNLTIRNTKSERIDEFKNQRNIFFMGIFSFVIIAVIAVAVGSIHDKRIMKRLLKEYQEESSNA